MGIIHAQGEQGAKAALTALDGALSKKMGDLCGRLVALSAQLGAWVDYPDDEIEELENGELLETLRDVEGELNGLLSRFDAGSAITQGVATAIVGKPNVGKSALMNLLSGFGRSIVTEIAGTTRDVVEQTVRLGSLVLHVADTAGIHRTEDVVEQIGVDRARQTIDRAGLVFAVFDLSRPLDAADEEILSLCKGRRVVGVLNKTDLPLQADKGKLQTALPVCVELCALSGDGLSALENAAETLLCTKELDPTAAMLTTERQRQSAARARNAVRQTIDDLQTGMTLDAVNISIDDAIDALLELTGEKVSDAVVDEVFARFCVGK